MRKYNFSGIGSAPTGAVAPIYKTKEQAEEEKNKGGFFGGAAYLGEKAAASFVQSLEGIWDYTAGGLAKLFGADDWAEAQFQNDWFGDWYTHADEWYNPGEKMKVAGDVAGGIGTSLPSLAAGVGAAALTVYSGGTAAPLAIKILGAALPATVAGLGAAGTSTKQAYQETGELGAKEFGYGALSGTVEGATEAATNALTLGGGAVIKNIGKAFGKEMTETVAKQSVLKGLFGAFAGEAFEEGLSEWVNPYLAQLTYDPNAEEATAQEIAYAAFVGGLSGMVMQGGNVAIDSGNSFLRGTSIANRGLEGEVLNLSAQIAAFQDANNTENEAYRTVAETYKKLSASLEKTGGVAETAAQRKMLGDLSRANVAAVFSPMITRSAAQIYANADIIAARLTEYGYKDANGKPMTFTAEQIREGITPGDKKSFETALKTNTVLRTLAVASTTGQLTMDTRAFRDATLAGRNLASRADLWNFAENATADEVRAVSAALGIENWETLTEDEFAEKIATFLREGGAERYAAERAAEERIFADTGAAMPLPPTIALEDGQSRKFTDGERELAIARRGEEYRIYDMATRTGTKAMSRAEVNKALADEREKRQSILAEAKENERRRAEIKRKREETDAWARENVKKYAELSAQSKTVVRKVIAAARASGLSEADVQMYATVSAHAGLDIVFSKRLCKVEGGYADAFWDPGKNRIVVNPEAKRSAEKILLHELDHAVRTGIRKDGGTQVFAEAIFGIDAEAAEKITARYKNVKSEVSQAELIWDEANAYFAETFFANKNVLASLTEKVPSLRERILAFFATAKSDYAGAPRLEGAAKRYYTTYKKMFDEFAERNADRNAEEGTAGAVRYALPEDDDLPFDENALATVDALLESEGIAPASVMKTVLPTFPESGREQRYSKDAAIKVIDTLPNLHFMNNTQRKAFIQSMYGALENCDTMAQKLDFAKIFAVAYVANLEEVKVERSGIKAMLETERDLRFGLRSISFSKADISELIHLLGEDETKRFLKRWQRTDGMSTLYPVDVFLRDLQYERPRFTSAIDGKNPIDAMVEIDRIYVEAKTRTTTDRYIQPFKHMTDTQRAVLEDQVYKGVIEGFHSADAEKTAHALEAAEERADIWQAMLEQQTADDRSFREAIQVDAEKRIQNLNKRNEETKKKYGDQVKRANIQKKGAENAAIQAKKAQKSAERRAEQAEERAENAEKRAERAIAAEEARAERVIEATEKNAARRVEKVEKRAASDVKNAERRADFFESELEKQAAIQRSLEESNLELRGRVTNFSKEAQKERRRATAMERRIQTQQKYTLKLRDDNYELRYRPNVLIRISRDAQRLAEIRNGDFQNSAEYKDKTFQRVLEIFRTVEWRGNFDTATVREAFQKLNKWYNKENAILKYEDDKNPGNYDQGISDILQELATVEGKFSVDNLRDVDKIIRYFTNLIKTYNKVYINGKWVDAKPVAQRYVNILHDGGKLKEGFFRNFGRKYLGAFGDVKSVMRYYDRYRADGFFTETFERMRTAAIEADVQIHRIMTPYEAFMEKHKSYLRKAEGETVEFMGVKIPKMTAISLYMTMGREQAQKGFAVGGFKFKAADGKTVRVEGMAMNTELTEEAILSVVAARRKELYGLLSDTDKEYIKVLEHGYNTETRALKAERDMERYGFTNVMNDYYYPIRRANTVNSVDSSLSAELDRVSNAGFNKDTVKGAAGELFIQNADTLYRNHVQAVCRYATLSPAIEAYNKLFNMDISGNPNHPISVKTESENVWESAHEYFRELIGDVQGIPRDRGRGMEYLGMLRGGYAKFQLGANPKTVATQLSSVLAASSILDASSLAKAVGVSGADVDKYCALAELRNADNTAAMAQGVLNTGKRVKYGIDKVSDAMMKPIGWMDRGVIRKLFAACQVQVAKNNGPKLNTEENRVEAGKLLTRVILETQQNSFATERSAAMRSGNEILRTLTMFSADAMKVTARVIDAFGEVSALRTRMKNAKGEAKAEMKSQLKRANKRMGKSVGAMLGVAAYSMAIAQLFRWLYDKEKDEDESTVKIMLADFAGNATGGLPLVKEVTRRFTDGFGVENYSLAMLNDLLDSTVRVFKFAGNVIKGNADGENAAAELRNLAYTVGQFTGIPARNIYNMLYGLTKRISPQTAYKVDEWFYAKNYENDLARYVREGDDRMTNMLLSLAVNDKTGSALSATAHTELHRLITAGYKILPREIGKTITVDGNEYEMSEEEREMVRAAYAGVTDKLDTLLANRAYTLLSDEEKEEAIRYLYNTAYSEAIADVYGIDRGNAPVIADVVGYDAAALAHISTKGIESDKGKDGKSLPGTKKKKTVAAINALNISTEKKLFLICAKGYSLDDGDVRGLTAQAAKKKLLAYILALPGKTKDEKARLAEMCGFAVKNGKISLKNTA